MGWGILGGSAVDAYQKAAKISRDQQFEDTQRAELARQRAQDVAIDAAANGSDAAVQNQFQQANQSGGSLVTPEFLKNALPGLDDDAAGGLSEQMKGVTDPQQAAAIVRQFQMDPKYARPAAGTGMPAPAVPNTPSPLAGLPPEQAAAIRADMAKNGYPSAGINIGGVKGEVGADGKTAAPPAPTVMSRADNNNLPLRAYRGDDGQMYMTASEQHEVKPSEMLMARAKAMMNAGGGVKGIQAGYALQQHAVEMMKSEQEQELNGIMRSGGSTAAKVQGLMKLVNGSPITPGEVTLERDPEGTINLVHTVPGKAEPFREPLKGNNEAEILSNLAMSVRTMTNPDLLLKHEEHQFNISKLAEESKYHSGLLDNKAEATAQRAEAANSRTEMLGYIAELRASGQTDKAALMQERLNRGNWVPIGEKDGVTYERDAVSGAVRPMEVPAGLKLYQKQTGEKPEAARTPGQIKNAESYHKWLSDGGLDQPVAKRIQAALAFGVHPDDVPKGLPPPAALPKVSPAAAAPAPAQGLQLGGGKQAASDGLDAAIAQTVQGLTAAQNSGNRAELSRLMGILQQQQAAKAALY